LLDCANHPQSPRCRMNTDQDKVCRDDSPAPNAGGSRADAIWNHTTPVLFSPLFNWPPQPKAIFLSLTKRWVTITRNALFLLLAIGTYLWLMPELSSMKELSPAWILPIFLRNITLLVLIAGGLHWYLFVHRGQGKKLKYDVRENMPKTALFSFRNQVHDNIFWSLASGATIWSLYEVLYFYGAANGVLPIAGFRESPVSFFLWLLVMPVMLSAHFYLTHRLLHWPPLFERYHKLHHRNIHIGPWSGMSMHPVEHVLYLSSVLIHFVIASHPVIVILHLFFRSLAPAFSHAGFEKLIIKDKEITDAADFHHQLHHRFFECNYGNIEMPWDRWLGSYHDGSDEATIRINERRKRMYNSRAAQR